MNGIRKMARLSGDQVLNRQFGLGKSPQGMGQDVMAHWAAQSLQSGFTQVPVIEYVTTTFALPILDEDIDSTFGDQINIMTNPDNVAGSKSLDSSFAINGILQVDMLVVGFGAHFFAEPQSTTVLGNAISPVPPAGSVNVSPDAYTINDIISGSLGPTLGTGGTLGTSTISPALLEWGAPAWNAMWHAMNAYQFNWIVQQRYAIIQELLADVAYFGPYAEGSGMSDSQEAAQRFANRANFQYSEAGYTGAFVPINAQRIGSLTTTAPGATNHGLYHPTRAYDECNVTWGGLRCQNSAGGTTSPFRKLPKPVLLEKGIPINMKLVAQDAYHQSEMQRYLSITDRNTVGGTFNAVVPFAPGSGGLTVSNANTFLELTLDPTPVTAAQVVQTDRTLMKGGAFKMAVLVKGFEVWGAWRQYLTNLVMNGTINSPTGYFANPAGLSQA